jgi:hypothetical protein
MSVSRQRRIDQLEAAQAPSRWRYVAVSSAEEALSLADALTRPEYERTIILITGVPR